MMGSENQRSSLTHDTGYFEKAHCTGKQAYLESTSQSTSKPVEGSPQESMQPALYKGGYRKKSHNSPASSLDNPKAQKTAPRTPQQHAATVKTQFTKTPRTAFPKKLIFSPQVYA